MSRSHIAPNDHSTVGDSSGPGQISFKQELARKATHMGALVIPLGYYFLHLDRKAALTIMIPITLTMFFLDIARLRGWSLWSRFGSKLIGPMIRGHEQTGDFTGASYILTSSCLTMALYAKPVAIAALVFIIVGDSFAAVFGRRYGRHRIGRKSIEGSFACLVSCIVPAFMLPDLSLAVVVTGAFAATVVEAAPLGIDDNISVPILAGLVMTLAEKIA